MAARGGGENAWNLDRVHSLFPILKERRKYPGTSLSGGQQQMLSIGRALMTNPELLLMDEPSEGLAPIIVHEVERIIAHLKESGFSILLVEQNLPMALSIADYIYIITKGAVVYECMPEKLKGDAEAQSKYLGVAA